MSQQNKSKYTPEEIQEAKDFLWERVNFINQELIVYTMLKEKKKERKWVVSGVTIGYQFD